MRILILLVLAVAAFGQAPLYIDLSGEWRISETDDPKNALPETDDRGWNKLQLPLQEDIPAGVSWIRRNVEIPVGTANQSVALGVGYIPGGTLYVNGVLAGQIEDGPVWAAFAASAAQRQLTIALRLVSLRYRPLRDHGPYLLGETRLVRRAIEERLGKQQITSTPFLLFAVVQLVIAVALFALWITARDYRVFLWTALYLLGAAVNNTSVYMGIGTRMALLLAPITCEVTAAAVGFRLNKWRYAIWTISLLTPYIAWRPFGVGTIPVWLYSALTAFSIVIAIRALITEANERRIAAIGLLLYFPFVPGIVQNALGLPLIFEVREWMWSTTALMSTALGLLLLIAFARQLIRDRRERQRLDSEMEAARAVQQFFLGAKQPRTAGYTVEAVYEPAQEVGGDFYQVLETGEGSSLIAVGDVSGKGLQAAMVVSMVMGVLRRDVESAPAQILERLNTVLAGGLHGGFVTCSVARLEPGGLVTLANAGNPAPYRAGSEIAPPAGLPLGVAAGIEYGETAFQLEVGEQLSFVSDGVFEAANTKGELFGFDRTCGISGKPAADIAAAARAWGQNDDITVVTVRRDPV